MPKEKAKELINKFDFTYIKYANSPNVRKQCVLIAVDEIIDALIHPPKLNEYRQVVNIKVLQYWKEVKQEIEKL